MTDLHRSSAFEIHVSVEYWLQEKFIVLGGGDHHQFPLLQADCSWSRALWVQVMLWRTRMLDCIETGRSILLSCQFKIWSCDMLFMSQECYDVFNIGVKQQQQTCSWIHRVRSVYIEPVFGCFAWFTNTSFWAVCGLLRLQERMSKRLDCVLKIS